MTRPNFVSGQCATCLMRGAEEGDAEWNYVRHGNRVVTAGMPVGPHPERALAEFREWCEEKRVKPLIFGCEGSDLPVLGDWDVTEIGRQPLFQASSDFHPTLSGREQPEAHRKIRRQARRALSKGVEVEELSAARLWRMSESGVFDAMLGHRWRKRGLPDFTFLVEFRMEGGQNGRRAFMARYQGSGKPLALVFLTPADRGWLLEHQLLSPKAPNGTAELILCRLLSEYLERGSWLSLGITPLYRELEGLDEEFAAPGILEFLPERITRSLLGTWEPYYGFRRLLRFRQKLAPDRWEPVYWAVPERNTFRDILAVLRAFSGGSLVRFAIRAADKAVHKFARELRESLLQKINSFYVITLILWIPILWMLDSIPLFGNAEACKVWAIYDLLLLALFALHHHVLKTGKPHFITDLLLGLVVADTVLAWIQTVVYHGGLPDTQPLGLFVFMINTAPISALFFLTLVKYATKPVPFRRRDLLDT